MIDQAHALDTLRSLAHPVRLQILWMLRGGGEYVCHLVTSLERRQAYVSQQLAQLRNVGLVEQARHGRYVSYKLCDRQLIDRLQELYTHVVPDCPSCVVPPAPWWLCPCPRCAEARRIAGLGCEPLGDYGISVRAALRDCGHGACVRVWQLSEELVATAVGSDCSRIEPWATQQRVVQVRQIRHAGQTQLQLSKGADGYICRASCLVPTLVLQAAAVAAGLGEAQASHVECAEASA